MYLRYVHSFRALAIAIIVAGHGIVSFEWSDDSGMKNFLLDLLDDGTVLFVFVAGFLFAHLSDRYQYPDYLGKKFRNVILPFMLISIPAVVYSVFYLNPVELFPQLAGTPAVYRLAWFEIEVGASINYPLWFIPMITLFYVAAPLFIRLVRNPRLSLVLLTLLVPLSLLLHRDSELNAPLIGLYFLPAYLAGMLASHYRVRLELLLDRWWAWLVAAFFLIVLAQYLFADHHGNYYGLGPFSQEHGLIDWMFAQKLLLCFALLGVMRRFDSLVADRLRYLGDVSFSVFFLHGYVLFAFSFVYFKLPSAPPGNAVWWAAATFLALALSLVAVAVTQRLFGARSRYLIGS